MDVLEGVSGDVVWLRARKGLWREDTDTAPGLRHQQAADGQSASDLSGGRAA